MLESDGALEAEQPVARAAAMQEALLYSVLPTFNKSLPVSPWPRGKGPDPPNKRGGGGGGAHSRCLSELD